MLRCIRVAGLLSVVAAVLVTGPPPTVHAAQAKLSLQDLAEQSTDVVGATVISRQSQWNDEQNFIFTVVGLQITTVYTGGTSPGATVEVMIPGGEVDSIGLRVEHAPVFETGEQVIVFLRPLSPTVYGVTGWEQGKYTVVNGRVQETDQSLSSFETSLREAVRKANE